MAYRARREHTIFGGGGEVYRTDIKTPQVRRSLPKA
jgi:hypothetical protein